MIEKLKQLEQNLLPIIKSKNSSYWNSLKIRYEEPFVDRLFLQINEYRFCIHRIYKSEKTPLYHPHDWPSAVKIIKGSYEMNFGSKNEILTRSIFSEGSYYEMLNYENFHSVNPLTIEVISFMVMGPMYKKYLPFPKPRIKQEELTEDEKTELLIRVCIALPG